MRCIDVTGQEILMQGGCNYWLEKLDTFLQQNCGSDYQKTGMTTRSVQFKFEGIIDVDLLLSPFWDNEQQLYQFLKTISSRERSRYSSSMPLWFLCPIQLLAQVHCLCFKVAGRVFYNISWSEPQGLKESIKINYTCICVCRSGSTSLRQKNGGMRTGQ